MTAGQQSYAGGATPWHPMASPRDYGIRRRERLPLAAVVAGLALYAVGFAEAVSHGVTSPYAVVPGTLGWFLVPLGVYLDGEALSAEDLLWHPGLVNVAASSVPFLGFVGGIVFLIRRGLVARGGPAERVT